MIRILRVPCSAVVVALAVFVVSAAAAQADEFTASAYPAILKGEGEAPSSYALGEGRKFECAGMTDSGELTESSETVKLAPKYSGCVMFIGGIEMQATTITSCEEGFNHHLSWPGYTQTVCAKNYKHVMTAYSDAQHTSVVCAYELSETNGEGVTLENLGGTSGVKVSHEITGIAYKRTAGSLLVCGPESGSATYKDSVVVTAKNKANEAIGFDLG